MKLNPKDDSLKSECEWTFLGANVVEWGVGLVAFVLMSLVVESPQEAVFAMILGWIITTYTLAYYRRKYSDQKVLSAQETEERKAA